MPDARREAERLLAHLLRVDRGAVLAHGSDPLDAAPESALRALVARRARGEPFQYLTGTQEFRGLELVVDRRVLVPRPETEELVEAVLRRPPAQGARVADLGTGSGCIAIALAAARPDLSVAALDRSADALEVARLNAKRIGVADRIDFRLGDFGAPPDAWVGAMQIVVSNPPYVTEDEWRGLAREVREHEPKEALVPGVTGLEAYEVLAPSTGRLLVPGGAAFVELGYRSADGARRSFSSAGFRRIEVIPDLRGIPRILRAEGREDA